MEYDLEFARKIKCSEEDKRHCQELVSFLLALAKKGITELLDSQKAALDM